MAALFVSVEGARVWKLLEVLVNDAEVDLRSVLTCRYKMQDMLAALPGSFPVQGPPLSKIATGITPAPVAFALSGMLESCST